MRSRECDTQIVLPDAASPSRFSLLGRSSLRYLPSTFSGKTTPFRMSRDDATPMNSKSLKSIVLPMPRVAGNRRCKHDRCECSEQAGGKQPRQYERHDELALKAPRADGIERRLNPLHARVEVRMMKRGVRDDRYVNEEQPPLGNQPPVGEHIGHLCFVRALRRYIEGLRALPGELCVDQTEHSDHEIPEIEILDVARFEGIDKRLIGGGSGECL